MLVWEPPRKLVFSWQISADWKCEPDVSRASEVEIRFTPAGSGQTRVELEHRHFERMTTGAEAMRAGVNAEGGWGTLLKLFSDRVDGPGGGHAAPSSGGRAATPSACRYSSTARTRR